MFSQPPQQQAQSPFQQSQFQNNPQFQPQPQPQPQQQQLWQSNPASTSTVRQSLSTPQDPSPQEKLQHIVNGWKGDAFQTVFYNIEDDPNRVGLYTKPPQCTNDALWTKALRDNPQPDRYVPVIAIGFDDIKSRVQAQEYQAAQHQAKLSEISKTLVESTSKTTLTTSTRLSRASQRQVQLSSRLLRLVSRLHPLTSSKSHPLRKSEEQLKISLEKLWLDIVGRLPGPHPERRRIPGSTTSSSSGVIAPNHFGFSHSSSSPSSSSLPHHSLPTTSTTTPSSPSSISSSSLTKHDGGKMASVLNELWVMTSQRKAIRDTIMGGNKNLNDDWSLVIKDDQLQRILQVLYQQQKTLQHLTNTLIIDQNDIDVLRNGFGLPPTFERR